MKIATAILAGLLGLLFVAVSLIYFFGTMPKDNSIVPGSPAALFMAALVPTGYLGFVKVCELVGGLLVAIPKTRNFGLLVLGPVIINILSFSIFLQKGAGMGNPMVIFLIVVPLFLLFTARKKFAALAN